VLAVVHEVEPGEDVEESGRVSRLAGSNTLHGGRQLTLAIERLAGLDLVHHLAHVHSHLAGVLAHAVEPDYTQQLLVTSEQIRNRPHSLSGCWPQGGPRTDRALIEGQETAHQTDGASQPHSLGEATGSDL